MANYVTNTSDKSRKKALRKLFTGGIGLHYFYVGRIGAGILYMIFGIAIWGIIIGSLIDPELPTEAFFAGILMLVLYNLPSFIKLKLGKFKDNIGNYLRE